MNSLQSDFFDIRILNSSNLSVFLDNGEIKEISNNFSNGVACRALVNGSWGYGVSDDPKSADALLSSAIHLAELGNIKSPRQKITLEPVDYPEIRGIPEVIKDPTDVPIEEKVSLALEMHRWAKVPGITSTAINYSESSLDVEYRNSEGVEAAYRLVRTGFSVTAVASQNGIFQLGRESRFNVCGYELFDQFNAPELARKAGKTAVDLLSAKVPAGGRMPVILDQELAGVFIHEAVGHAAEADHVVEGNSILAGKVGNRIASPAVTVIDDPTMHDFGYFPADDEGVRSKPTTLIENGILSSYLHSRETAALLPGTGRPGHSRSQGLSRPIIRMSNTFVENGDSSFQEMLSELKNGIYLIGSRGGQVNPGEGVFQFNAERGFIIEDGELAAPVRDVSLSGHILDLLMNVEMAAGDRYMSSGRCGKGGQLVPVSDGAPHILVSSATVGGSG